MVDKTITKTKRRGLMVRKMDLKEKQRAVRVMDVMRKKHKVKAGEKNSTEIIRHFRNTRYNQ